MQLTQSPLHLSLKNLLLLALMVLAANWFFTFQLVCLKDDNSFYYMPVRMYLSDALHTQGLPYWNPYLMNGVPIHADMQGAVWNPIAFVLAFCFHYNHTCFLVEYLIYIVIAAAGMWRLASLVTKDKQMLFAAVVVYTCCGFVSGVANFINWTASLGFIPWMLYCFYALLQAPNFKNACWFGVVCWLMIVCGYPAFLIYAAYCMIAVFVWWAYQQINTKQLKLVGIVLLYLLLAVAITIALALPAIVSYVEFLPFYSRGHDLATDVPYRDCFYPQFLSSLFVPTSVYNKAFDPLCHSANRDLYFGILPLLLLGLWLVNIKQHSKGIAGLLLGIGVFTFVFLFGYLTPLGNLVYKWLPLMGAFKWSAAVRIFLVILIVFAMLIQQQKMFQQHLPTKQKKFLQLTIGFMFIATVFIFIWVSKKYAFETTTHQKLFQLNAAVQAILLLTLFVFLEKIFNSKKKLLAFIMIDLLINYSLGMAMTGVGNVRPAVFNDYCKAFYQQNPDNYLDRPLANNRKLYMFDPWHNHNASKIMNGATFLESNTVFSTYEKRFLTDTASEKFLREHAFIFSDDAVIHVDSIHLSYNSIEVKLTSNKAGHVVLQQNNYFRWKEKSGIPITTYDSCFMQLPVQAGSNQFQLYYDKGRYPMLIWISVALLAALVYSLFFANAKKVLPTQR
jgi:hypothetical protein